MSIYRDVLSRLKGKRPVRPLSRRDFLKRGAVVTAGAAALGLAGPMGVRRARAAGPVLPAWTSSSAVSDVFVVEKIPAPGLSLAGGVVPSGDRNAIFRDPGIDTLVRMMGGRGISFFRTASSPQGLVGRENVVVVKVNYQWAGWGSGNGAGRLGTNTDLLKGLIWRILNHPEGFTGEVVIAENTQDEATAHDGLDWAATPANSQFQDQTIKDLADAFTSLGYPVSLMSWSGLDGDGSRVSGGDIGSSPAAGEYSNGNLDDCYILLNDPGPDSPLDGYSYPKFRTAGGSYVSLRHGVWESGAYHPGKLTFINLPVLKRHGMAGTTAAWKNFIGFITCNDWIRRFTDWDRMHGWFWGYQNLGNTAYGLLGRQMALVRRPDLNILDAIWVATENNYASNEAVRADVILAGQDPFALDWYASEYLLRPLALDPSGASAARAGTFRSATLVNQKAAKAAWSGTYPWMDLDQSHALDSVADSERLQMNVFVSSALTGGPSLNLLLQG